MPELKYNGRIVNGEAIRLPYQLELRTWYGQFCGGVLISPKLAITALHCIQISNIGRKHPLDGILMKGKPIDKIEVVGGHFWKKDPSMQKRKIKQYHLITLDDDIIVIELNEPFLMTPNLTPACLPTRPVSVGTPCVVSGWGARGNAPKPKRLQAARIKIAEREQCGNVDDMYLCGSDSSSGSCGGDSGGPLVCETDGGATLHGIVSANFDKYCKGKKREGIYTDVFYFKNQIEAIMYRENEHTCPINLVNFGDRQCNSELNNKENCFDGGD